MNNLLAHCTIRFLSQQKIHFFLLIGDRMLGMIVELRKQKLEEGQKMIVPTCMCAEPVRVL